MKIPHRCADYSCRARVSLPKKWGDYDKPPACKTCGHPKLHVDSNRWKKQEQNRTACRCQGYHFPHKKGSKWCEYVEGSEMLHKTTGEVMERLDKEIEHYQERLRYLREIEILNVLKLKATYEEMIAVRIAIKNSLHKTLKED